MGLKTILGIGAAAVLITAAVVGWTLHRELSLETQPIYKTAAPRPKVPVAALLDRMAGADSSDGSRAWLELASAYTNPDFFFEDVKGSFDDPRPIAFHVAYVSNVGPDKVRRSGYVPQAGAPGAESEAHTVGEALRLDMWRMEGAGLGDNPKPFGPWWAKYRKARGLGEEAPRTR